MQFKPQRSMNFLPPSASVNVNMRLLESIARAAICTVLCAALLAACNDSASSSEQTSSTTNTDAAVVSTAEITDGSSAARTGSLTDQQNPTSDSITIQAASQEPQMAAALPAPVPALRKPFKPAPGTTWQWQLSGALNTSYDVAVYDIDLFDTPQAIIRQLHTQDRSVICYFSAGSFEEWRMDAADFPDNVLGKPLGNWPGERWLDIRSAQVRELMAVRLNLAKLKGCDAIEPDNVDSYTHDTGFPLSAKDQINYNLWLAREANNRGLSVGLKNNLEQMQELEPAFDFAIVEQCSLFGECERLKVFTAAGKAVFRAEYGVSLMEDEILRKSLCKVSNREGHSTLVLPQLLNDRFRFDCLKD